MLVRYHRNFCVSRPVTESVVLPASNGEVQWSHNFAPIGLTLTVVHIVGIPLDGTSVNPARSIGPALFEGGSALSHLWLFIVAPLLGGAVAALVAPVLTPRVQSVEPDPTGADVPSPR